MSRISSAFKLELDDAEREFLTKSLLYRQSVNDICLEDENNPEGVIEELSDENTMIDALLRQLC